MYSQGQSLITLLSYKWPKYGPFMAKIWLSYDTTTWFILNLNHIWDPEFSTLETSQERGHMGEMLL